MYLDEPLLRLPLRFDPVALAREIDALPSEAWTDHPQGYQGNDAVRFVTVNGNLTDAVGTPMAPTRWLEICPYVKTVMGALGGVWGRCRLMRLAPGAIVPPHVDVDFYWRTHVRIHVPIVTNLGVNFTVRGETVHMAAGEAWVFDTFSRHNVANNSSKWRTHLVLDTVGGDVFSEHLTVARNLRGAHQPIHPGAATPPLTFERHLGSAIMSPWELSNHMGFLRSRALGSPITETAMDRMDRFASAWHGVWAQCDDPTENVACFGRLIANLGTDLARTGDIRTISFGNQIGLDEVITHLIRALIHPELLATVFRSRASQSRSPHH